MSLLLMHEKNHHEKRKKRKGHIAGFTLVELMIVIVILVILAAVSVPLFAGYANRAKEAICITNLSSVSQWLLVEKMMNPELDAANAQSKLEEEIKNQKLCPLGGAYLIEASNENLVVYCSVHGKTPPQVVGDNLEKIMSDSEFSKVLKDYFNGGSNRIAVDSTGPNFGARLKPAIQKVLKVSDQYDFRLEWNRTLKQYTFYIFGPATDEQVGREIEVTKYVVDENGKIQGSPEKGTGVLKTTTTSNSSGKPIAHNVLSKYNGTALK